MPISAFPALCASRDEDLPLKALNRLRRCIEQGPSKCRFSVFETSTHEGSTRLQQVQLGLPAAKRLNAQVGRSITFD